MFEFEKQILKGEGRYPTVSYPYTVLPISDKGKLAFARWNSGNTNRIVPEKEKQTLIEKLFSLVREPKEEVQLREPLTGSVRIYEDVQNIEIEVKRLVVKKMALAGVPNIEYMGDTFARHTLNPLEIDKDFKIEIGERVVDEPPLKLTFDDIKAL